MQYRTHKNAQDDIPSVFALGAACSGFVLVIAEKGRIDKFFLGFIAKAQKCKNLVIAIHYCALSALFCSLRIIALFPQNALVAQCFYALLLCC
jgi:hypothetical protein